MPDEKLGGKCREDGCFKPAGHPDEHGIGRSEVLAHLEAMGPNDKLLPHSCPLCKAAKEGEQSDGDRRCPMCNDEGVVHTHDGQIIGPCECAQIGGSTDG